MTYIKSHFRFSKGQRNGIFLLLLIILALQCLYYFVDFPSEDIDINSEEIALFIAEIDSLKQAEIENNKFEMFPFNPNFISDFKGYTLGMTNEEIDRLHAFRELNKYVNSAKEFQQVTKVSDSLLERISPFFKFPEWVTRPKAKQLGSFNSAELSFDQKIDLNIATAGQLQRVNGIGEKLSERIIIFRNKFPGGFIADVQLSDVYGLSEEVIKRITDQFTVKTPRQIVRFDLNIVTVEQLVTIQHIDYELAHEIIDQRTLRDGFSDMEELKKVKGFPENKFDIIKLYLQLK